MENRNNLRAYRLKFIGKPSDLFFKRAEEGYKQISPFLIKGAKILDIGSGAGHVTKVLRDNGFDVTPLDIKNQSRIKSIQPTIYDGAHLPFGDKSFDIALLLVVLHHAKDSLGLLREASRVAKRIIISEDIYFTTFGKHKTHIIDNILNFDFFPGHHANRSDDEWKKLFQQEKLSLIGTDYWKTLVGPLTINQALYCVENNF